LSRATAQIPDERAAIVESSSGASRFCGIFGHLHRVADTGDSHYDTPRTGSFLHLGGTHVHHLNYGIFLLSTIAAVLLFGKVNDAQRAACAVVVELGWR